ncbi:MAG: hypothetical protein H6718_05450 [Polyangiaceae bacterium]|nr:hypothetical protein [Polyangiaceae bacterium]MCB9607608.1 hypothetical protein [Polyangiaceae bacterium]
MDRSSLDRLQRQELIELARSRGIERPEVMTRDELIDEILRLSFADPTEVKSVRGWFGVARDLLAGLVEQGLHLPDAAKVIRGDGPGSVSSGRRPLATVTLAEIYAAQGHLGRGIAVLQEVLEKEPEHEVASRLLSDLEARKLGGDDDFPEESFAWSDAAPATPAESPAAIESRSGEPLDVDSGHDAVDAPSPDVVTPLVSYVDSDSVPAIVATSVEPSAKAEVELEAPTLRTTQLSDELPPSEPVAANDATEPVDSRADTAAAASPVDAELVDAEPEDAEPEQDTSPNASEQAVEEPTLESIPKEIVAAAVAIVAEASTERDAGGDLESPDSCVLFVRAQRIVVSWCVAQASFARHLSEQPDGAPVVRLAWWAPGLPASRHSLDVAVTQAAGELLVEPTGYSPHAILRGALGWRRESGEFLVMATAVICALDPVALLYRPHAAAPPASAERADAAAAVAGRYA